jgi:hypothetical protein
MGLRDGEHGRRAKGSSTRCSRPSRTRSLDAFAALREGADEVQLACAVSFAAVTRIARFPTSNEFGDWDTALHTFTFANAVEQGLRRSPSPDLLRGVFDAAMSVHLDRFLNVPAVRLPEPEPDASPDALLSELPFLLDEQQRVDDAGRLVASYLGAGGSPERLIATLGSCLLRENRNFHTIQCVEATCGSTGPSWDGDEGPLVAGRRGTSLPMPTTRPAPDVRYARACIAASGCRRPPSPRR